MSGDKSSINLEASAKLEIKTEVPADASGRLIHAALDTVSPLTEWLGSIGDRLRIHRKVVVARTIRRAEELIAQENRQIEPVPMKIAVPLLEHASQEEADDAYMIERWASLLASSTKSPTVPPYYVTLLGNINGSQARLLKALSFCPDPTLEQLDLLTDKLTKEFTRLGPLNLLSEAVVRDALLAVPPIVQSSRLFPLFASIVRPDKYPTTRSFLDSKDFDEFYVDLRVLDSLRLVDERITDCPLPQGGTFSYGFANVTLFGQAFLDAVCPETHGG